MNFWQFDFPISPGFYRHRSRIETLQSQRRGTRDAIDGNLVTNNRCFSQPSSHPFIFEDSQFPHLTSLPDTSSHPPYFFSISPLPKSISSLFHIKSRTTQRHPSLTYPVLVHPPENKTWGEGMIRQWISNDVTLRLATDCVSLTGTPKFHSKLLRWCVPSVQYIQY